MVILESERLVMRNYRESDLADYHEMMSNKDFRKEAEKPNAMWLDGQMRDRLEFAINRDEYADICRRK